MDLSKMSTEELLKMRGVDATTDLSKVSTEDLLKMRPKSGLAAVDDALSRGAKNIALGAVKGASNIGATLLRPVDAALNAAGVTDTTNAERRAGLKGFFKENADPESLPFKGGELGAEIAGTAGIGGALAKGVTAAVPALATIAPGLAQYAPRLAAALESGGFTLGGTPATTVAGKAAEWATRTAGGAIVGGTSAGLVNPRDAAAGAVLGGTLPVAAKVAGMAGKALASEVSPEVSSLYQKAKNLGIDIPADRIANSKPLNAVASSLNYVPLSGRAATEEKMTSQLNRAVSRTFGQDSDNVTAALRKASTDLGKKFETTLQNNTVRADNTLLNELVSHVDTADKELGRDGAKIIGNMADEIMSKVGQNGEIDGQAAYNIKKALDRIGNRNAPEAYYARELKKSLMGALDRSLGPDEAASFAKVRQQYGNMLDLENLATNGAEGGISVARLANMKGINNKPLQDLADIAAQFVKPRESPHGAMQRVLVGSVAAPAALATGTVPALALGVGAGRTANAALNSDTLKRIMLNQGAAAEKLNQVGGNKALRALLYSGARSNP